MGLEFLYQVDNDQIKRIQSFEAIKLDLEKKKVSKSKENIWATMFPYSAGIA